MKKLWKELFNTHSILPFLFGFFTATLVNLLIIPSLYLHDYLLHVMSGLLIVVIFVFQDQYIKLMQWEKEKKKIFEEYCKDHPDLFLKKKDEINKTE